MSGKYIVTLCGRVNGGEKMNKKNIFIVICMVLPVLSLAHGFKAGRQFWLTDCTDSHGFKALGFWGVKRK